MTAAVLRGVVDRAETVGDDIVLVFNGKKGGEPAALAGESGEELNLHGIDELNDHLDEHDPHGTKHIFILSCDHTANLRGAQAR